MNKKTVVITGAANGIGKAAAKIFIENGYTAYLLDIDEENLKILTKELGEDKCFYKYCDIGDIESVKNAFAFISGHTGNKLNVLVSNAGVMLNNKFESFSAKEYKDLININSFGNTNTILQALPALKNTEESSIVILSSSSGMFGIPDFAVYSGTKAYLKSLTEALSTEFKEYKINVSSVMPLFVQTNMMEDIKNKYKAEITPYQVAREVYTAATTYKKRHYFVGKNLWAMDLIRRLLPTKAFQKFVNWYLNRNN